MIHYHQETGAEAELVYHHPEVVLSENRYRIVRQSPRGYLASGAGDEQIVLKTSRGWLRHSQETDSQLPYTFWNRPLSVDASLEHLHETFGDTRDLWFSTPPNISRLIGRALVTIHEIENPVIAKEAKTLLSVVEETLVAFRHNGFDLNAIPPLRGFPAEDGSFLLEWISKHYRIGISIEPVQEESGWYMVSDRELGEISASGYLSNMNLHAFVSWLLSFIISNPSHEPAE